MGTGSGRVRPEPVPIFRREHVPDRLLVVSNLGTCQGAPASNDRPASGTERDGEQQGERAGLGNWSGLGEIAWGVRGARGGGRFDLAGVHHGDGLSGRDRHVELGQQVSTNQSRQLRRGGL